MPLQKALSEGKIKISGAWAGLNTLEMKGPAGTEIRVDSPLALTAEPWLEKTQGYQYKPETLTHFESAAAGSTGAERVQSATWNRIKVAEVFGDEGVKFIESSYGRDDLLEVTISTCGKDPVIWAYAKDSESLFPKTQIIRREGGRFVKADVDAEELNRQQRNIFGRVNPLATDDTSYVVLPPEGDPIFISKNASASQPLDFFEKGPGPIENWLASKGKSEKPNLIVVVENDPLMAEIRTQRLRAKYGDNVRIYQDDDPNRAAQNVKAQRPIKGGSDLAIYSDSSVKTGEILSGLEPALKKAEIPLVNSGLVKAGNLIIVTGHKDAAFRKYLADLALSGALKDKAIALLSCAEASDQEFSRFLINEGGATCILRMNDEIDSAAAREVLIKVAEQAQSMPTKGKYLDDLLKDAADAAASDAGSESFKAKIRVLLDHSLQVSLSE
jgi:hypothetical protein